MKTTIRRDYEATVVPDGTLRLEYRGNRLSPNKAASLGCLAAIGAFFACIVLFALLARMFGGLAVVILIGGPIFVAVWVAKGKRKLVLSVSRDGVISAFGDRIAKKDIAETGYTTNTEHVWNNRASSTYVSSWVYANVFGKTINLSGHVADEALASALLQEMRNHWDGMNESA